MLGSSSSHFGPTTDLGPADMTTIWLAAMVQRALGPSPRHRGVMLSPDQEGMCNSRS
jgi:hypothetical protein